MNCAPTPPAQLNPLSFYLTGVALGDGTGVLSEGPKKRDARTRGEKISEFQDKI